MPSVILLEGPRRSGLPSFLTRPNNRLPPGALGNAVGDWILKQDPFVGGLVTLGLSVGTGLAVGAAAVWAKNKVSR